MATLTTRFPDRIARGATGGHGYFSTSVVKTVGGAITTNQLWEVAKGQWNVSQALKKSGGDMEAARDFLYMARGGAGRFRFKDWTDYQCARAAGRLVQITTTTFQASKAYGAEPANEYVRQLRRLVTGTVQVWRNAAPLTLGVGFTVAVDTGIVTLATPIGADTLELASEFDVPCRFVIDAHNPTLVHRRGDGTLLMRWEDITIEEVPE